MMETPLELGRSLLSGKLDLLCPKMELRRCPGYHDVVMSGIGTIRANENAELRFRMAGALPHPFPEVLRDRKPAGTMYDIDDHVMLVALDSKGREWRSDPLLVHLGPGEMVHGQLSRSLGHLLHPRQAHSDKHCVELYLPSQRRFPLDQASTFEHSAGGRVLEHGWSLDHHRSRIGEADVTFRIEKDNWLSVSGEQPSPFMPDWPGLMCHALSFSTSTQVRPAVLVRSLGDHDIVGLYSGPFHRLRTIMPRPIVSLLSEDAESFWSLLERFFMFAWDHRETPLRFLDELEAIRAGAIMSLPTACLTLTVGLEALVNEFLPSVPPRGWDHNERAKLETHVAAWNGDARTRDRVLAWMRSEGNPRPIDRLFAWATKQGVEHRLIESWKAVRNTRAHGGSIAHEQPSVDAYFAVVELLFRIVASAIGYDGKLFRSSVRGWEQEDEP